MTPFPPNYCNSEVKGLSGKAVGKGKPVHYWCVCQDRQTDTRRLTDTQTASTWTQSPGVCVPGEPDRQIHTDTQTAPTCTQTDTQSPHAHRGTHRGTHRQTRSPPSHQAQQVPALQFPARPQGVLVAPGRAGRGADPRASRGRCAASAAASPSRGDGAGR